MRVLRTYSILLMLLLLTGCAVFKPVHEISDYMTSAFRPKGLDYRMSADEATGEWDQVAIEGRGDRPRVMKEKSLFQLESPKAREITRNLGFEDY
jgi:hypothetical protein